MESEVHDSKCNRAFYSHHIDLRKHFYTFIHINNYCNCNFVILIDNTLKFLTVNNKFLIVHNKFLDCQQQISDCQQQISDCQQKYLLLLTCLACHRMHLVPSNNSPIFARLDSADAVARGKNVSGNPAHQHLYVRVGVNTPSSTRQGRIDLSRLA